MRQDPPHLNGHCLRGTTARTHKRHRRDLPTVNAGHQLGRGESQYGPIQFEDEARERVVCMCRPEFLRGGCAERDGLIVEELRSSSLRMLIRS